MRKFWFTIAALAALTLGGVSAAPAADCGCQQPATCGCNAGGAYGNGSYASDLCDPCGDGSGGLFGNRRNRGPRYEGLNPGFNCGCNGSYKYPVPPLYTYHWPGMWSAQLMTDYHSPWRFPPLKPYTDELPGGALGASSTVLRRVQPASAIAVAPRVSRSASFSSRLEESLR